MSNFIIQLQQNKLTVVCSGAFSFILRIKYCAPDFGTFKLQNATILLAKIITMLSSDMYPQCMFINIIYLQLKHGYEFTYMW